MKTSPLVVAFAIFLAGCGCTCNSKQCEVQKAIPANAPGYQIQRCTADSQCSSGACDPQARGCLQTCGATRCTISQLAVGLGADCKCVNVDGIGSACLDASECTQTSPFGTSTKQLCLPLATPVPGGPNRVCVSDTTCDTGPNACTDPDPAHDQVAGDCRSLASAPPTSSCSSKCVVQQGPTTVDVPCRFDQIATMVGMECQCLPRPDPFGQPCTDDASCAWPSSTLAGNAGPARACKVTAPGVKLCVPTTYCRPESAATCHDGIDQDCDGVDEATEAECAVEYCDDQDQDTYCGPCYPASYTAPPRSIARSACTGFESAVCDANVPGNDRRHPGVPELCSTTEQVDDNCDGNVDEGCQHFCWDADSDGFTRREGETYQVALPPADRGQWLQCANGNEQESASCDERDDMHSMGACPARQCRAGETAPCLDECTGAASSMPCNGGAWGECRKQTYIDQRWSFDDPQTFHRCGSADTDGWLADWSRDRNCYMWFGPYVKGTGPGHVVAISGWTFGRSDLRWDIVSQQGGNVLASHDVTVEKLDGDGHFCLKSVLNLPCGEEIEVRVMLRGGNSLKIYASRISPILKPVDSTDDGCP